MNHLIPEQRADKNGKLVTRHVKPIGDDKLRMAAIPAPALGVTGGEDSYEDIIRREFLACGATEDESRDYADFTTGHGEETQRVVAEALLNRRDHEDYEMIKHVLMVSNQAGVIQLAVDDVAFMRSLAGCLPDAQISSKRNAYNLVEDAFRKSFKLMHAQDVSKVDYLKHAKQFRASVMAMALALTGRIVSSFEEREQEGHLLEHYDTFIERLPEFRRLSIGMRNAGVTINSRDLLSAMETADAYGTNIEAFVAAVEERGRYDEEEIKDILTTTASLSQGVI